MNHEDDYVPEARRVGSRDASSEVRMFAAWMGLVLVAMGVAMAGYLFYRIGQVLLDPRAFETQVDRWEFVVRGRTTDAFPDVFETPDRQQIGAGVDSATGVDERGSAVPARHSDKVDETAQLVGRIGSKAARPAALFVLVLVLLILVKIVVSVIHAGIRLAGLAGGEREYMKRIVDELVYQRRRGE